MKRRSMKSFFLPGMVGVLAALAVMLSPAVGQAVPILDFGGLGAGGSLVYDGINNVVTGTNVGITSLFVTGASSNNGTWAVQGGFLNFVTGPAGGSITLVGAIPGLGLSTTTSLILSGNFASFLWFPGNGFQGSGSDVKNLDLLAKFGLNNTSFGFFGFSIGGAGTDDNHITASSTDIKNQPVSEPASLLLLGSGLAGLGLWKWSRRRDAQV